MKMGDQILEEFSPEKAEIIGLLCAEGSYYNSFTDCWLYYPNRDKSYFRKNKQTTYIQFANFDINLLNHFKNLVYEVYNYNASFSSDRIRICNRNVIKDLLKYTDYGHLKCKVPVNVLKGDNDVKIRFIRGFFDGEGTTSTTVRMFSTNERGLRNISLLLEQLNIKNTFNGPCYKEGRKPYFYIYIRKCDENKFLSMINPVSKIRQ